MKESELKEIIKAAYHWGRDNGSGKSEKNLNDFLNTSLCKRLSDKTDKRWAEVELGKPNFLS